VKLLDNIFWHALSGPQAHFAAGSGAARRFAQGFSPILGFQDAQQPDFGALSPYCEPGEHFYCACWTGPVPSGWRLDAETTMAKMVWDGGAPEADAAPDAVRLGPEHAAQAVELAALTRPGPFGPRTIELGEYFGYLEGGRLVAMAGERVHAGTLREISGVCTHPQAQGRGFGRKLMLKLVARQLQRGETPVLHVMTANATALGLYGRMGFKTWREVPVRVVTRMDGR